MVISKIIVTVQPDRIKYTVAGLA